MKKSAYNGGFLHIFPLPSSQTNKHRREKNHGKEEREEREREQVRFNNNNEKNNNATKEPGIFLHFQSQRGTESAQGYQFRRTGGKKKKKKKPAKLKHLGKNHSGVVIGH